MRGRRYLVRYQCLVDLSQSGISAAQGTQVMIDFLKETRKGKGNDSKNIETTG